MSTTNYTQHKAKRPYLYYTQHKAKRPYLYGVLATVIERFNARNG